MYHFNNIYIYALPKATPLNTNSNINYLTPAQKSLIINGAADKKTLTSDVIIMDPVYKTVTVGYGDGTDADINTIISQTRLVVKLDRTAKISTQLIQNKITGIVQSYFDPANITLGFNIDLITLAAQIESILGVSNVYTQRLDTSAIIQGISLVVWNPSYPDNDITITSKNYQLQNFQALYFNDITDFSNRIIVTSDVTQDTSVITI